MEEPEPEEEDDCKPKLFGDVRTLLGCEYVIDVKAEMALDLGDPIMAVGKYRWVFTTSL